MKTLNSGIVAYLSEKLGVTEGHIRNKVSVLANSYPKTTPNGVAHIFAQLRGLSVRQKLDKEDKASLPQVEIVNQSTKVLKAKPTSKPKQAVIISHPSTDVFISGHIAEINRAYNSACYTAVFILLRKVVENLIIDILRAKFPTSSKKQNLELYYDKARGRYQDFSIILVNLYKNRVAFGPEEKAVEKLYNKVLPLKNDANDKTHSWFHLVTKKKEIEDLEIPTIMALINAIEKSIGIN